MKKYTSAFTASCLLFLSFFFTGCIKDTVTRTYTYTLYEPVYQTVPGVRANIKSGAPAAVTQPGKLFIKGAYIFLNEVDKGIHVIDNSNPAQPKNVAFISIPGNVDMAVKGNTLYADLYTDLITLDITDPAAVVLKKVDPGVFPHRAYSTYYGIDTTQVVVDWIVKDTTVTEKYDFAKWKKIGRGGVVALENDCSSCFAANYNTAPGAAFAKAAPSGMGGSMARFSIVGERLYTVGSFDLRVMNISNPAEPTFVNSTNIGWGIETLYPFQDKLFIGSTNGMFIYNITNPDQPVQLSQFSHVQSCDPVIADENHAYVTLRSGTACNGFTNQLDVLNITNLLQPSLIKTYPMTNPHGLSKDGDLLFICDGVDGLKLYDASKPDSLQLLKTISGLETYDVIAYNGRALVVAKDGLYQFDYTDRNNIKQLSKITLAD